MDNEIQEYAGFWRRVIASFIDTFALFLFQIVIGIIAATLGIKISWIVNLALFLYHPIMESSSLQATLGKLAAGIRVTGLDGNRISFLRALGRNLAKILSFLTFCIGFLMAAFTGKKQALHDMVAGTLVVKTGKSYVGKGVLIFGRVILVFFIAVFIFTLGFGTYVHIKHPNWQQFLARLAGDYLKGWSSRFNPKSLSGMGPLAESTVPKQDAIKLSEAEYDALLTTPSTIFSEGLRENTGAISIQLSPNTWKFGPSQKEIVIKVGVAKLPNLNLMKDGGSKITIAHVWNKNNQDLYDPNGSFETEFFQKVKFSDVNMPFPHLEGERKVHIIAGVKEGDVKNIEGRLILSLPLDIETLSIEAGNPGPQVENSGVKAWVDKTNGSEVVIRFLGDVHRYVTALGYNEAGEQLGEIGSSWSTGQNELTTKRIFRGKVKDVKVIVASRIAIREYPFVLGEGSSMFQVPSAAASTPIISVKPIPSVTKKLASPANAQIRIHRKKHRTRKRISQ